MALRSPNVRIIPHRVLETGQITLAASAVAQILVPVTVAGIESLAFGAFSTNTAVAYWGTSAVLTTTGVELVAGQPVNMKLNPNFTPVYIIGTIGNKFWWATLA